MPRIFKGVNEKLKRADENILNLNSEFILFFEKSDYPTIPNENEKVFQEAVDYHSKRPIPLRFSILTGEIIHHFRSILDHITWQLSSTAVRGRFPAQIEFPVFARKPITKDEISRYDRKVQGISDAKALTLIESLQPYNRLPSNDPLDDPVWIIHDLDRIDKHRELVLVFLTLHFKLTSEFMFQATVLNQKAKLAGEPPPTIGKAMQMYGKVSPNISFRQFGKRENQSVIPSLTELLDATRDVVRMFAVL
jgi:hypothetical protein